MPNHAAIEKLKPNLRTPEQPRRAGMVVTVPSAQIEQPLAPVTFT